MMRRRIVPIHEQCFVSGVEIVSNDPAGIGLLIDESQRRTLSEQALIDRIADSKIRRDNVSGD